MMMYFRRVQGALIPPKSTSQHLHKHLYPSRAREIRDGSAWSHYIDKAGLERFGDRADYSDAAASLADLGA